MFEKIKNIVARFIIDRHIKRKHSESNTYNNFISGSNEFLLVYPASETDYHFAGIITEYLISLRKNVTVFLPEYKVSLLPLKSKVRILSYSIKDISRFNLPTHQYAKMLANERFDVVIDLNLLDNIFFSAVTNYVASKFRAGFKKGGSDKYYNFQVSGQINAENSYRNLLNSFQMF